MCSSVQSSVYILLPACASINSASPHLSTQHFPFAPLSQLQPSSLLLDTRIIFSSCLPHHIDQSVLAASWQLMLLVRIRALQHPHLFPPSPTFFSLLLLESRGGRERVRISCNRPFKCFNHKASLFKSAGLSAPPPGIPAKFFSVYIATLSALTIVVSVIMTPVIVAAHLYTKNIIVQGYEVGRL